MEFSATDLDGLPVPGGAGMPGVEATHPRRPGTAGAKVSMLATVDAGAFSDDSQGSSSSSSGGGSSLPSTHEEDEEALALAAAAPVDGVAWLRHAEAARGWRGRPGPSAVFTIFGSLFFCGGGVWFMLSLLQAMPWLIPVGVGAACFALALVSNPAGLVSLLPQGLQDLLTKTAVFDLIYDDSNMQNFVRKWGRIMMLVQERPENEVAVIMKDLDHDFVDSIFRRTLLQWFPPGVRRLMLPEDVDEEVSNRLEGRLAESPSMKAIARRRRKSHMPRPPTRSCSMDLSATAAAHAEELTPGIIVDLMRDRSEKRVLAITEKPLLPAIWSLKMMSMVATWRALAASGLKAAAGCGSLWYAWGLLWPRLLPQLPASAQAMIGRNFATAALAPSAPGERLIQSVVSTAVSTHLTGRVIQGIGLMGLVCAGSTVATVILTNVSFLGAPFSLIRLIAYKETARDHEHDHDRDALVESAGHVAEVMAQRLMTPEHDEERCTH